MPDLARLAAQVALAATTITPCWPLRSFIAANPLRGLEDHPFETAAQRGAGLFAARTWPAAALLRAALADGRIAPAVLAEVAARHGRPELADPAALASPPPASPAPPSAVNRVLIRWLAAFLDEGQAAWPMPGRSDGLWRAMRRIARHDPEIPRGAEAEALPEDPLRALATLLAEVADAERTALLTRHLAALPGWAGHLAWRVAEGAHPEAPAGFADLLALRLFLARQFAEAPEVAAVPPAEEAAPIWLEAWEETWRRGLLGRLAGPARMRDAAPREPQAQLVFCIDVRSEVLRRHLEPLGPWETLGFAGFFGAAVAVQPFGAAAPYASCPVLLQPRHVVPEVAVSAPAGQARLAGLDRLRRAKAGLRALKESVAGAFGFVEAAGPAFGAAMVARTLAPHGFARLSGRLGAAVAPPAETTQRIGLACDDGAATPIGLTTAEQAATAEGALRIMGLTRDFAPLVVLCGHGGQAVNNPFAAGLDCGACGGHRGGPNARIMAAILNEPAVRTALAGRGIAIPAGTRFLPAEHDTTTDEVTLLDTAGAEPRLLERLRADLARAGTAAAAERLARLPGHRPGDPRQAARHRARDWAETRPEWALARNAGFIVAGRDLTRGLDLEGRCFLHSYDWQADAEGTALEVILTAPLVVAQWINTQYYFSTVDNAVFGAGNKVTQSIVGGFGVMQGAGSDLMSGLPAQSVMGADGTPYHEPLRLLALVQAPRARVEAVVARHRILRTLFDHGWVALAVADPETGRLWRRSRDGHWQDSTPARAATPHPIAA